jgi:hypothetical protein
MLSEKSFSRHIFRSRQTANNEVKAFQAYLSDYQLNIVSKEHQNTLIYSGPDAEKRIYLYSHHNHYDIITSMLVRNIVMHVRKVTRKLKTISVVINANCATHRIVQLKTGYIVMIVTDFLKAPNVSNDIKQAMVNLDLFVHQWLSVMNAI